MTRTISAELAGVGEALHLLLLDFTELVTEQTQVLNLLRLRL
jgi:hypothetical protein